jgi:lambda repressor-like predicted transcriptional regulator
VVNPIGGTSGVAALGASQPVDRSTMMANVAKLLGMSVSDLKSKLDSGSSLSDVAKQRGVSQDQLLQTIQSSLKAQDPNAVASSLNVAAQRIAARHGHHGHHGGGSVTTPAAAGTSSTTTLNSLASALGMNSSDLVSELKAGTPLSDIGQQQGVSSNDLTNLLGKGLLADIKA